MLQNMVTFGKERDLEVDGTFILVTCVLLPRKYDLFMRSRF